MTRTDPAVAWADQVAATLPAALLTDGRATRRLLADLQRVLRVEHGGAALATLAATLPTLPDPVAAATGLLTLLQALDATAPAAALLQEARLPEALRLFSGAPAAVQALLRQPEALSALLPLRRETPAEQAARLAAEPVLPTPAAGDAALPEATAMAALRRWKDREFLRLILADFAGTDLLADTVAKISAVADRAMAAALQAAGLADAPVAVIAMGKWGGLELNYHSDIDLLFVAADTVDADTLAQLSRQAALASRLLETRTADGYVFRVDSRLRPEGRSGPLLRTLTQYAHYYRRHGRTWEFQALVKARHGAGSAPVAAAFLDLVRPLIYQADTPAEDLLRQVRGMKQKIEQALALRHADSGNVKLGRGGIRDIEFITQFLQLHHGRQNPDLRVTGTRVALKRLRAHGILTPAEYSHLDAAYSFLRVLEHYLQVADGLPLRQLPTDPRRLRVLARMLGHSGDAATADAWLLTRYTDAIEPTRRIFSAIFDHTILYLECRQHVQRLCPDLDPGLLQRHFRCLESSYFLDFDAPTIAQHLRLIAALHAGDQLARVAVASNLADPGRRRVTIVAHDYLGEFAKISGLLSAYHLDIVSGESYTYADPRDEARQRRDFYRRPGRSYRRRATRPRSPSPTQARLIVCVAEVRLLAHDPAHLLSWTEFEAELNAVLRLLRDDRAREAAERVSLRAFSRLGAARPPRPRGRLLPPLRFSIDNDSHHLYTILEVSSPDQIMFLYDFTNVLSTRDYYIGRVEIRTVGGEARDRLFLTTVDGQKIVDERRLRDLRVTLTLIKQFGAFLADAPNPQLALRQFSELVDHVLAAGADGTVPFVEDAELMADIARVLGSSAFLWEDFLRLQHESLLPLLMEAQLLDSPPRAPRLRRDLRAALRRAQAAGADPVDAFNACKDREMFRIDLRHLTRRVRHFTDFCHELSVLADVVLAEALRLAIAHAGERHGRPMPGSACVCALGKWGGREIGYASDIELLYVWDAPDAQRHHAAVYHEHVAQRLHHLVRSRRAGIFELDWRLRPGGRNAPLATPLARFSAYFTPGGEADPFERQALLRLRPVCGAADLQQALRELRRRVAFRADAVDLQRLRHLRRRQVAELVARGTLNAKFSPGGLVEAEYFIQILQMHHGARDPRLRSTNTKTAAAALRRAGILSPDQHRRWLEGYRFLRAVINALRIVRGHARDLEVPPADSLDFAYLTRRLTALSHAPASEDPRAYLERQMASIHAMFQDLESWL